MDMSSLLSWAVSEGPGPSSADRSPDTAALSGGFVSLTWLLCPAISSLFTTTVSSRHGASTLIDFSRLSLGSFRFEFNSSLLSTSIFTFTRTSFGSSIFTFIIISFGSSIFTFTRLSTHLLVSISFVISTAVSFEETVRSSLPLPSAKTLLSVSLSLLLSAYISAPSISMEILSGVSNSVGLSESISGVSSVLSSSGSSSNDEWLSMMSGSLFSTFKSMLGLQGSSPGIMSLSIADSISIVEYSLFCKRLNVVLLGNLLFIYLDLYRCRVFLYG